MVNVTLSFVPLFFVITCFSFSSSGASACELKEGGHGGLHPCGAVRYEDLPPQEDGVHRGQMSGGRNGAVRYLL